MQSKSDEFRRIKEQMRRCGVNPGDFDSSQGSFYPKFGETYKHVDQEDPSECKAKIIAALFQTIAQAIWATNKLASEWKIAPKQVESDEEILVLYVVKKLEYRDSKELKNKFNFPKGQEIPPGCRSSPNAIKRHQIETAIEHCTLIDLMSVEGSYVVDQIVKVFRDRRAALRCQQELVNANDGFNYTVTRLAVPLPTVCISGWEQYWNESRSAGLGADLRSIEKIVTLTPELRERIKSL